MSTTETISKWLKDPKSGKILMPKTMTSCVFDENGKTVEDRLKEAGSGGGSVIVDSDLSETSTNPVQNKVITAKMNEVFQSVSDGKSLIASAITDKGVTTEADAAFQTMADNVGKIATSGNVTYGGTGVGGLATYYDLQAAPVQTAE